MLPRAPFSAWLSRYIATQGGLTTAAVRLGMDASGLSRHVRGRAADRLADGVQLNAVDHVITAADAPHLLAMLYPQELEMHDRWCESCHDVVTTNEDLCCPWCEESTTP